MKRSSLVALLALSSIACSAKGTSPVPSTDAAPADASSPDVSSPDVSSPDALPSDVTPADAPPSDVTQPDAPAADVTPMDAPSDAAPTRCARDLDCSGVTFCSPDGVCVPLVCTPGRLMCVSPARAQVCDGRGATFTEMDCPGGCVLNNCMGAMTTCPSPRVTCGTVCTDVQTSASNCGRCGNACATGQTCVAGACVTPCAAPSLVCGTTCTDVQTSVTNCGRCGNACAAGQSCVAGACVTPCPSPNVMCGAVCADVQTNASNCGRCGNACATGQSCVAGVCTTACPSPRLVCGGACTDVQTSVAHCGRCGNPCATGQSCVAGVCVAAGCSAPSILCSGVCVDPRSNNGHCGRCDNPCPGGQSCVSGVCSAVCAAPRVLCGASCVDLQTSLTNCGRCGNACGASQMCTAGACTTVTTSGFRVLSLSTTGCQTVEHNAETGDDRGGIALTPDRVFYNADGHLGRWQAADMSGFTALSGPRDGMISDLATNTVYSVISDAGTEFAGSNGSMVTPFVITQLAVLEPTTMALTPTRITLRASVTITHDAGFFSGHGFVLVYSGQALAGVTQQWYRIDLPSGAVTTYPVSGGIPHHVCEVGAWWGVAERAGTDYYAVFVRNNTTIGRIHLGDNVQSVVGLYTDLADICSITVSPSRNRWYFHFEGNSEIAPLGVETTGYCAATFAVTP